MINTPTDSRSRMEMSEGAFLLGEIRMWDMGMSCFDLSWGGRGFWGGAEDSI